jgi:hypothetical protein
VDPARQSLVPRPCLELALLARPPGGGGATDQAAQRQLPSPDNSTSRPKTHDFAHKRQLSGGPLTWNGPATRWYAEDFLQNVLADGSVPTKSVNEMGRMAGSGETTHWRTRKAPDVRSEHIGDRDGARFLMLPNTDWDANCGRLQHQRTSRQMCQEPTTSLMLLSRPRHDRRFKDRPSGRWQVTIFESQALESVKSYIWTRQSVEEGGHLLAGSTV